VTALGNIGQKLRESGHQLIQGFIEGIKDMAGSVVQAIKDFVLDKIAGPVKRFLHIGSPSQLMADVGRNVGEGLVIGIDGSSNQVARAMERLVPAPRTAIIRPAVAGLAENTLTTGAFRARSTSPAPVTVNVHPRAGQSEYEIGRIAARELAWAAKH
jgi:hypothetical protein